MTTPTPPQRELGFGSSGLVSNWWGGLTEEEAPDFQFPAAYRTVDKMLTNPQAAGVFSAIKQMILGTGWRINGTGCRDDITHHIAQNMSLPIVGVPDEDGDTALPVEDRFSWDEHVAVALDDYLRYGHGVFEQQAEQDDAGLWWLARLGWRSGRTLSRWNTGRNGSLISIEQTPLALGATVLSPGVVSTVTLPIRRLVVYSRERKGDQWHGESLLRPAYSPWMLSSRGQRIELILAERIGSPIPIYEAAPNEVDLENGRRLAQQVRAGTAAGGATPNGASLRMKGIEGSLPDLDKTIRRHEERIAGSMMANFINLGASSGTGSYALGSVFFNAFLMALQKTAKDIARTASRHVIGDIVAWNWPGERAPRLEFDEIGARRDALVQALATLVGAGVLTADQDLEEFVRSAIGIPALKSPRPASPVGA